MSSELNYNVDANDPEQAVEAVPAGEYIVVVEDSDYVENKKGTGMSLKLTYQVIQEGPFKGRKIFENLNLEHENNQTVQIARRALNSLCMAVGFADKQKLQDSAQLHDIPLKLEVTVIQNEGYAKQNNVRKHIKFEGETNPSPGQPAPPVQDAGGTKKPAWQKE